MPKPKWLRENAPVSKGKFSFIFNAYRLSRYEDCSNMLKDPRLVRIIVSNHGGRNLDTVPASIEALPVVAEKVAGRVPLLMDGGIRRGTDVVRHWRSASPPSSSAVPLSGVRVLSILRKALEIAMALTG